jgi:hypothetical protein
MANIRKLSDHALAELADIRRKPVPSCSVNPGVARRLIADGLVEIVELPSPFKTHKGARIAHLQATRGTQCKS